MSGSGISWAICKSAPRSRQITMPAPHHFVFYRPDALPATQPTASKHWRQCIATLTCDLSLNTTLVWECCLFSDIDALGGVATCIRCGGIFNSSFVANFLENRSAKKFRKSVQVWWSYCHGLGISLFMKHGGDTSMCVSSLMCYINSCFTLRHIT